MPHKILDLTEAQKARILEMYPEHDLATITRDVFQNPALNGHNTEGITVKTFLVSQGKGTQAEPIKTTGTVVGRVLLSDDQRKQIEDLVEKIDNVLELARIVWSNPNLKQMSKEYRAVYDYYKAVFPKGIDAGNELVDEAEFSPPTTMPMLIGLVNECVPSGDTKRTYNWNGLKPGEERQLRALMSYLRSMLFKVKAGEYDRKVDRNLYISVFVKYTHDKPDLTHEEVDQYVHSASETVNIVQIERELKNIQRNIVEVMNGDRESRGQFMPMVELLNTTRGKLDQSKTTLKKIVESLVGTRSKRLQDRDTRNSSILNLFDAWQKDQQMRDDIIELGLAEKEGDLKEVGRIRDLDDVTALVAGQTEHEASMG